MSETMPTADATATDTLPTIVLKPREERRLRAGHLWIFSNEIASIEGDPVRGSLVRVTASRGILMGTGIFNPGSLIAVRLTSREETPLDAAWFSDRIQRALRLREKLYPGATSYRLLHSESDGVPGVIADRFDQVIAVQIAAAGMDERRELLYDALMEIPGVEGVVERNDHPLRALEGLPERVAVVRGTAEPQTISDGLLRYQVDPLGGQKTGFYLDQRENRHALRRFMPGARVLDLYTNTGGFALHARHAGAGEIIAVDSSEVALRIAVANMDLNGLDDIRFRLDDAFATLQEMVAGGEKFDLVIADPPPFARSKKHVAAARKKYVELFTLSLQSLAPEGIAFLATCSHHITRDTFMEMIRESLSRAKREGMILEERGASADHPVHPMMPETGYLHGVIVKG